jgi:hypothetical protein
MAIPFRRSLNAAAAELCAYLAYVERGPNIFGGLLITEGTGLPKEFVHNQLTMPGGLLWPESGVRRAAGISMAQSLFGACEANPSLLLASCELLERGFDPAAFAVSLPFALVENDQVVWVGLEPAPSHPAFTLLSGLGSRNLLREPFARVAKALQEVYGLLSD